MKNPALKRMLFRFVALSVSLFIALVLAELVLQVHNPIVSRVQHDRIVLPRNTAVELSNIDFRGLDDHVVHAKNSLGFRGADPPEEWDRHLTVLFVGGSTTELYYHAEVAAWPHLVGESLSHSFHDLWWNNAGLDGHSTYGHGALLADYLAELRPDVVVFLIGTNDVGLERPRSYDSENVRDGLNFSSAAALVKSLGAYSELAATAAHLYRWNRARRLGVQHQDLKLESLQTADLEPTSELEDKLLQHRTAYVANYSDRVRALITATRELGAQPVLLTQPMLLGEGVDDRTGVDLARVRVDLYEPGLSGRTAWAILELYNDATRSVALEQDVLLIDTAKLMPKSSRYFYDAVHFTNDGSAELAGIVRDGLCPWLASAFPEHQRDTCGAD